MQGLFIVFEGPDGAGTTFHSERLAERLRKKGKDVVLTREPTDGALGTHIRSVLKEGLYMEPDELQKNFCDDRAEHVERVITPALHAGKIVICDRYVPSTLVYGEAAGVSLVSLRRWNQGFPKPDIFFLLLPSFDVSYGRLLERMTQDEFEQEMFQKRVHGLYERYAKEHTDVIVIDTSKEKDEVHGEIWKMTNSQFPMPNQ